MWPFSNRPKKSEKKVNPTYVPPVGECSHKFQDFPYIQKGLVNNMKKPRLIYLYLDDIRQCPQHIKDSFITITIRDYESAISTIHYCNELNLEFFLDFDHDLGEGYSGYDVAKYIVENKIPMAGYTVHSQNPVGAWNIHQLLSHYGYGRFEV